MAQTINTNVASLNAQRNLNASQGSLATSLQRLSSGLRINSAKDDAAGLSISDRMQSQVRGLNQAVRNANDAISLSQTAEGAMAEIGNNLQRLRELSIQSANDTNSASDRAALQQEVIQLKSEIDRVAGTTQFNGQNLIDGSFQSKQFQVGANANQTLSVSIGNAKTTALGNYTLTGTGTLNQAVTAAATAPTNTVAATEDLTISGPRGQGTQINVVVGSTGQAIAAQINDQSGVTGVTAEAKTAAKLSDLSAAGTITFDLTGKNSSAVSITASVASTSDLTALADAINNQSSSTGITAEHANGALTLKSEDGYDIKIANFANTSTTGNQTIKLTGVDYFTGSTAGSAATLEEANNDSSTVGATLRLKSDGAFGVSSGATGGLFNATNVSSAESMLSGVDISTRPGANSAIDVIDAALSRVNSERAKLGAIQNRVTSTIANLQTSAENISASRGRIVDADFASETANLTRGQILQQAGTAMLAQANSLPQGVLSLLRG
ncbi:flagellin N-terminal helical domain-containing protein [Thauera phenylacetica]|uniref:flagellin N-terminal helical domain-containing protein n=1 Tax=Thauera phenylacetica TaxID=164400 RepID=UPI000587AA31|nr:flagellin [Thauera phenylacetica]